MNELSRARVFDGGGKNSAHVVVSPRHGWWR